MVLGGNLAFRRDTEVLTLSQNPTICTQPSYIPDIFSKSAVGAYFDKRAMLCGGWLAGRECAEYDFEKNEWYEVPYSLTVERAEAAGTMLENGSWIIIGGKGHDAQPLFSTDFLNNGLFETNLQWPETISGHCSESLNSSHLFISGGEGQNGKLLDAIYFLNVDTSFWLSLDEKMKYSRRGHVCGISAAGDNKYIVIAGGQDILKTELLDIKMMRFRQGPDLAFEMDWAASIQFGSSFVIVGGEHIGFCSKADMCISSNSLFEIDIQNNIWKVLDQTLKLPRSKHIIIAMDNKVISNDFCQDICLNCKGK